MAGPIDAPHDEWLADMPCRCFCGVTSHSPQRISVGNGWCDGYTDEPVDVLMPNGRFVQMCRPCAIDAIDKRGTIAGSV